MNYRKLTATQVEQINHTPRHSEEMPHQEEGIRPRARYLMSYMRMVG